MKYRLSKEPNDRIGTAPRYGPKLRGLIWFVYTATWTTALLTPQPAQIADAVLNRENAFYASKTLHVSGYAVLAILTGWLNAPLSWRRLLVCFLSAHALGTEFFQRFVPNRYPSWADVGLDHIGIVLGLILSWGWWAKES
jgi:VanZ family protein